MRPVPLVKPQSIWIPVLPIVSYTTFITTIFANINFRNLASLRGYLLHNARSWQLQFENLPVWKGVTYSGYVLNLFWPINIYQFKHFHNDPRHSISNHLQSMRMTLQFFSACHAGQFLCYVLKITDMSVCPFFRPSLFEHNRLFKPTDVSTIILIRAKSLSMPFSQKRTRKIL